MNKTIATLDVSTEIAPRLQWSAIPDYQELLDDLAFNDRSIFSQSIDRRIDSVNKWFFMAVGPSVAIAFGCLAVLWLGWASKDALRPYALIASAWMSVAFMAWTVTLLGVCALAFYRYRKLGVTGLQTQAMQKAKTAEEATLRRLDLVPLRELEEAKDDFTHQSSQASTKAATMGALATAVTAGLKFFGDVFGFSPTGSPLPAYIGALFLGVALGAAVYLSTKPKFERMAHVLGKAVRRAKERKPAPALDV